ncbi:hypothetical protein [Klebsiella pneumoniae]|uniref:hypothetical protein n=1 Tax=Klebsiella pneumoniae TaxID=573 RepID=UPI001C81FD1A|nr:hypothetical protein [Klebsiella pneumoniae]MBX4490418.1 hypothetical protein [Klebsiella pneumoniae]MBX4495168.1 hypothetical protein [Klebsiella pneumoniae]
MNIETVNELIRSLESASELSIREQKFLKLAKAFKQLAAENVALKDINAWCKTDAFKNMCREFKTAEAIGCSDVDCMHDAMLVAIMHAPATPATDRIVAGIKADGVEEFAESQKEYVRQHRNEMDQVLRAAYAGSAVDAERFAKQLREGADK